MIWHLVDMDFFFGKNNIISLCLLKIVLWEIILKNIITFKIVF